MSAYFINSVNWMVLCAILFNVFIVLCERIHSSIHDYERLDMMKLVDGGHFLKGINDPKSDSGEYPVTRTEVKAFYVDIFPVSNYHFAKFIKSRPGYRTTAGNYGKSWVLDIFLDENVKKVNPTPVPGAWWVNTRDAKWSKPEGPGSTYKNRMKHPVVHVSKNDAYAYCFSHGKRLPTEDEWEFAARGGLHMNEYPWGDIYKPNRSNLWQGDFPHNNLKADHWWATSPVDFYQPQNNYGLYDLIGNVWEWTSTEYYERMVPEHLQEQKFVVKGGSYIDHKDGFVNHKVRTSQRMGLVPLYTAHNVGFRCVRSAKRHWRNLVKPMDEL